ncbi:MAG: peptidylprolyl isomerase [Roseiflexaceae bacterium]|jgi:peptidyl-prolyl cis-trans isomerase A (cyclophilin A)|nr:peptidylprolyl isomerase [Chloroflexaceae bacterium]MCE2853681.1 peptidylprolyl isomerase [Chloroflexaceae bacterium]
MSTIRITTPHGIIRVALDASAAPHTVANFLAYVRTQAYTDGGFWRTVVSNPDNQPNNTIKIDVIQGTIRTGVEKLAPLPLERTTTSGLCHRDGTISMGRFAPDSAQADFFICIGDQPELDFGGLRNPDGQGFAAFGQVIEGMDVVRVIHRQPQHEQQFTPAIPIIQIDEEVIAR